jgi:hypothetical protein
MSTKMSAVSYLLALAALLSPGASSAQEKALLEVKGEAGRIARYKSETTVSLSMMGQSVTLVSKETSKLTVTNVDKDGNVTFERKTEESDQTVNGEKIPSQASEDVVTLVVRKDGSLVSIKSSGDQDDPTNLSIRLYQAQAVVFPKSEASVGSKWSHTFSANAASGAVAAKADYELLSFEDLKGVRVAKIRAKYAEAGAQGITSQTTQWVEVASGDTVRSEYEFNQVPFPGPTGDTVYASAKGQSERTEGSPVKGAPGTDASDAPKPKLIDEVTKGFEKMDGLVTVYRKRESGRTTIYFELKEDQLGQLMMLQCTAATGNSEQVVTGNPINDLVFKFQELQSDRITIVVPNYSFRASASEPVDRAVQRSFAESFLEQFNVEARQPDRKSLLIDVSDFLRGDIARISSLFQGGQFPIPGLGGGRSYSLDREKSYVDKLKVFPENFVAETVYNFMGSGGGGGLDAMLGGGATSGDPRSVVVRVVYNLSALPVDNGYVPRRYDARVGFFTTMFQDLTNERDASQIRQWILRWDLRKKDPSAALSEPVTPIKFWLDNAIPLQYRDAVKQGLTVWNKAFEGAGFKNAIVVEQMPDDADWDPADMRYNVVRWVASPDSAYAVALFRPNPLTGQILNASILVDSGIVRYTANEKTTLVDPASFEVEKSVRCDDPRSCRLAQEGMLQAYTGRLALDLLGSSTTTEKEYLNQFVMHVVAHEFGHILGLRHNFIASTELTLDQLKDPAKVGELSTSASVMDYVPFNVSAIGQKGVPFYAGLGSYDHWAIKYGYSDFGAMGPGDETRDLARLASQTNSPGLAYQSDEAADNFDPYVSRFDLSARPGEYWLRMLGLTRDLIFSLESRRPARGRSYWEFTRDYGVLFAMHGQAANQVVRTIGGLRRNANFKGDPGERPPLAPIPGPEQRAALDVVTSTVLAEGAFNFPKSLFDKFAPNPDADFMTAFLSGGNSYPVLDQISNFQNSVLNNLMSPARLSRVANNEFKAARPQDALTMATVFRAVDRAVWSELDSGKPVSALRRSLQRRHLDLLIQYALRPTSGLPADARMLSWNSLRTVLEKIWAAEGKAQDEYTPAHLQECATRIVRAFNAVESVGGQAQAAPSLLDLLMGGREKEKLQPKP